MAKKSAGGTNILGVNRSIAMELAVILVALAGTYQYMSSHRDKVEALTGPRVKRYSEFDPFYTELYRSKEHSLPLNRYLHFTGTTLFMALLLNDLRLLPPALLAVAIGLNVFQLTLSVPHGWFEFFAMMGTFLVAGRMVTGNWKRPFLQLLSGYGFAWVGHFFIEKNRPATFTYATYSLLGDMRMWYETLHVLKSHMTSALASR